MERVAYSLLPLAGGALVAIQAPVNARLRVLIGSPVAAGFVSFAIGAVLLLVVMLAAGHAGSLGDLGGGPWWAYIGGACGTALVLGTLLAVPRIGVLATFVAVIVGEVAMSLMIDRYGWFQVRKIPLTWDRLAGVSLMVGGLALILRRR